MKIGAILPLALLALLMGRKSGATKVASTDVGALRDAERRARAAGNTAAAADYAARADAAAALHRADAILGTT